MIANPRRLSMLFVPVLLAACAAGPSPAQLLPTLAPHQWTQADSDSCYTLMHVAEDFWDGVVVEQWSSDVNGRVNDETLTSEVVGQLNILIRADQQDFAAYLPPVIARIATLKEAIAQPMLPADFTAPEEALHGYIEGLMGVNSVEDTTIDAPQIQAPCNQIYVWVQANPVPK